MPKSKEEKYSAKERLGDIAKWTWEGMVRDIKKHVSKVSKKLDLYRDPKSLGTKPIEPRSKQDEDELRSIFFGENMPQLKPKKEKK